MSSEPVQRDVVRGCKRVMVIIVLGLAMTPAQGMAHTPVSAAGATGGELPGSLRTGGVQAPDGARGLVTTDLERTTGAPCGGLMKGRRSGICTHGPDPAPAGRDVREARSTAQLRQEAGLAALPSGASSTPGTASPPTDGSGAIACVADGIEGKRVEVLYVRPDDRADRFEAVKDALGQYSVRADRQLNASAAETGASRHWRFVTDPDPSGAAPCVLRVTNVVIGSTADDTFDATISALRSRGYNRADRKYLLYVDSYVYCGIGSIYNDSQPGQGNLNNGSYAQYARVDAGCWNYAEAHELMHNLGGVQQNAPHATPGWHCTDEADEMCYDDDGFGPVFMRDTCTGRDGSLFDCNHDDYFLAGAPAAGTYLATHWNTAMSAFLHDPTIQRVSVPDVRYEHRTAAIREIRDAGLVPYVTGSTSPSAWVASQFPGAGTLVPLGSTVTLRLQAGPLP